MGSKLLLVTLFGLLAASVVFLVYGWNLGAGADISGFGYGAMAFGIIATLLVGCGLMAAVFLSARYGYDEEASGERRDEPGPGPLPPKR